MKRSLTTVRLLIATFVVLAASTALPQERDPYLPIEAALRLTLSQTNIVMDVGGWQQIGRDRQSLQLRAYAKGGNILVEQYIRDVRRLLLISDSTRVWRYDPVANEHTYMAQPPDPLKTAELVAAWSRSQFQRPLRILAGSVRWLVAADSQRGEDFVRVFQTRPLAGEDWRGTDIKFTFDDQGRLDRFTIEDRHDTASGFKHVWLEGLFAYPDVLNVAFKFEPPRGSRPVGDLPIRIGGDGG